MSYLLTEIAMEMLGWGFYDDDGVARPINFEGTNSDVCEGVENLVVSMEIDSLPRRVKEEPESVVKAEIDSGEPCHMAEIINFGKEESCESHNEQTFRGLNENNQSQDIDDEVDLEGTGQVTLFGQDGKLTQCDTNATTMTISADDETQMDSVVQTSAEPVGRPKKNKRRRRHLSGQRSSRPEPIVLSIIDLTDDDGGPKGNEDIEGKLEVEIEKIATDLKRQKTVFFKAIPEILKQPLSTFQGVLRSYREQEIKNLEIELKNLQALREEAELKSLSIHKDNYTKYLDIFKHLNGKPQNFGGTLSRLHEDRKIKSNAKVVATTSKGKKQGPKKSKSKRK